MPSKSSPSLSINGTGVSPTHLSNGGTPTSDSPCHNIGGPETNKNNNKNKVTFKLILLLILLFNFYLTFLFFVHAYDLVLGDFGRGSFRQSLFVNSIAARTNTRYFGYLQIDNFSFHTTVI